MEAVGPKGYLQLQAVREHSLSLRARSLVRQLDVYLHINIHAYTSKLTWTICISICRTGIHLSGTEFWMSACAWPKRRVSLTPTDFLSILLTLWPAKEPFFHVFQGRQMSISRRTKIEAPLGSQISSSVIHTVHIRGHQQSPRQQQA